MSVSVITQAVVNYIFISTSVGLFILQPISALRDGIAKNLLLVS